MKKTIVPVLTLLVLGLLLSCSTDRSSNTQSKSAGSATAQSTPVAPSFTLQNPVGEQVSLEAYKGKVVILDFWATWCPPCRREIPHFIELQKQYGSQGLQVVGVSVDQDGWSVVKPFVADNDINYPILMYTEAVYNGYQQLIPEDQRGGIPFTFVLDRQGRIRAQYVGYRDKETFESVIKPLLGN